MSTRQHHSIDRAREHTRLIRVDEVCDAFEVAWRSRTRPKIEDYLVDCEEAFRDELLQELLLSEWELRVRAGETIEISGYLQRFRDKENRINKLFREGRTGEGSPADGEDLADRDRISGSLDLNIRCPNCNELVQLKADSSLSDAVTCPACDSRFNLTDGGATSREASRPASVGHFELIERLGIGAFGSVWKARDTQLDRTVAVKIPRGGPLDSDETDRFLREARIAAQLRHPNIVSVHEVGRDGDTLYIVSDAISGVSLGDWLKSRRMTAQEAAKLCVKLADALHYAHQSGVIHRDLKPQNILLDAEHEPYLTDFGLARRDVGEVTMTTEGHILGTPAYMAPEQARGEGYRADRRTDVYSLGVILFELLTAELPFRGNARLVIQQVLGEDPPTPRRLNAAVPRDLENIALKCLEKEAERRYGSACDLSEDLQRYLDGKPVRARPVSLAARTVRWCKRRPAIALLAAAVSLLLLLLTAGGPLVAIRQSRLAEEYRHSLYISDLQSAMGALEMGDMARAVELLERYDDSDLRTVEWHILWQKCQSGRATPDLCSQLKTQHLYAKASRRLVYSAKGDLAAAHFDGTLTIWRDGVQLHRLPGHVGYAQGVAFSKDGALLASGGDQGLVKIWDVESGELARRIETGRSAWSLAFLDNDVVLAPRESDVGRWNARTGKYLGPILDSQLTMNSSHDHGDGRFAVTRDGTLMARSDDRGITLQNLRTNEIIRRWQAHDTFSLCLSFSDDNRYLITGGGDGDPTVKVWNVETQDVVRVCTLRGHTKQIRGVCMSPVNDDLIASVSWDKTAKLWSISHAKEVTTLIGHSAQLFGVGFAPDGETLATAGMGGAIKLWNLANLKVDRLIGHEAAVTSLAFLRNGGLVSSGRDGTIIWDGLSGNVAEPYYRISEPGEWNDVVSSPVATVYATFSSDSDEANVVLFDYVSREVLHSLPHKKTRLSCLAYSPSGDWLATGAWNGNITLWNVGPSVTRRRSWVAHQQPGVEATDLDNFWGQPHMVHDLVFVNDQTLVSIGADRTLRVWTLTTKQQRTAVTPAKTFRFNEGIPRTMAHWPDGDLLAVGDETGDLSLWRTEPFERLATWFAHSQSGVFSLGFVPPGDTLISGGYDGTLKFWDTRLRSLRLTMEATTVVSAITVSADGETIAWAGDDGVVRLMRIR